MKYNPLTRSPAHPLTTLYAVILAGGPGERFWPVSRVKNPKYAMHIAGPKSIIEQTVARVQGLIPNRNILIVTTKEQIALVRKKLKGTGARNFLIEPCPRDTAAAIGLAAAYIGKRGPLATMVVLPADHYIKDKKGFQSTVKKAIKAADKERLVTIGIKPTYPATGYGYIKIKGHQVTRSPGHQYYEVERFVEKPDKATAQKFLRSKRYFWNSGMFIWKVDTILDSIKNHMPQLYKVLIRSGKDYKKLKKISIDYGVMEKSRSKAMVQAEFDWIDLGSWISLAKICKKDKSGNVSKGCSINCDTKGSVIISSKKHLVAATGVKNLVIVHTKDATLVADKNKSQEIKRLVALIRKKGLKRYL